MRRIERLPSAARRRIGRSSARLPTVACIMRASETLELRQEAVSTSSKLLSWRLQRADHVPARSGPASRATGDPPLRQAAQHVVFMLLSALEVDEDKAASFSGRMRLLDRPGVLVPLLRPAIKVEADRAVRLDVQVAQPTAGRDDLKHASDRGLVRGKEVHAGVAVAGWNGIGLAHHPAPSADEVGLHG